MRSWASGVVVVAGCVLLGACSSTTPEQPEISSTVVTSAPTSSMATSVASSAASTTSSAPPPSTSAALSATTTLTTTAPAPAQAAPTVVECLPGTPGPARFSDGSQGFSQLCVDRYGASLPADSPYTAPGAGYQCPGTDAFVKDPSLCTPANLGGEPLPAGGDVPSPDCPAAVCGYGTDAQGNPNPTSGES
ncbi:hypothetical protein [Corynebacterium aquilae]|uniref:hypothetical protein n=1 Tax=Corynebacterium aquilae TaxID=203263 RepID=UPI001475DA49|nr:hypothetical protein [Corynebacterium aquilae]